MKGYERDILDVVYYLGELIGIFLVIIGGGLI